MIKKKIKNSKTWSFIKKKLVTNFYKKKITIKCSQKLPTFKKKINW